MAKQNWDLCPSATVTATGTAVSYVLQQQAALKTTYVSRASSTAAPHVLELNHDIKPIGNSGNDRHYLTIRKSYQDSEGKTYTDSFTLSGSISRCPVALRPESNINTMASELAQVLLSSGFVSDWIDGITP